MHRRSRVNLYVSSDLAQRKHYKIALFGQSVLYLNVLKRPKRPLVVLTFKAANAKIGCLSPLGALAETTYLNFLYKDKAL